MRLLCFEEINEEKLYIASIKENVVVESMYIVCFNFNVFICFLPHVVLFRIQMQEARDFERDALTWNMGVTHTF